MKQLQTEQKSAEQIHESLSCGLDAFIKLIVAIVLTIIPFIIERQLSFIILCAVLIWIAVVLRIKLRTLLLSAASYGVIVIFPFLFGMGISVLINSISANQALFYSPETLDAFLRLLKLFIVWYVSILYFHTTPMSTVLGLLDQLLSPLKRIGVPIQDYLKVVMCIVLELKETGSEMKHKFLENARSTIGSNASTLKDKFKGVSHIIVTSLVNSFDKLDKIQSFVENVKPEDLFGYTFKLSRKEGAALLFAVILIFALYLSESGVIL